jgi:hypothetical protein
MGSAFAETKTYFVNLPSAQQTRETLVEALLRAEKNAHLESAITALAATKFIPKGAAPPHVSSPAGSLATSCNYVRKLQGKREEHKPGERCTRIHRGKNSCWMKLDDQWLKQNPGADPGQIPYWGNPQQRRVTPAPGVAAQVAQASEIEALFPADVPAAVTTINSAFYSEYLPPVPQSQEEIIVLDNGAAQSCFKAGSNIKPLPNPVQVSGACKGNSVTVRHSATLPCPALGQRSVTGLYSPSFNHNLLSVRALQQQGVDVVFPAHQSTAECRDPSTGRVTWRFQVARSGLYEARVQHHKSRLQVAAAATTTSSVHPTTLLHQQLGHPGDQYLNKLIQHQAITGLPATFTPPPTPHASSCVPCIQAKAQSAPHPQRDEREADTLSTVHVDLVGPLSQASVFGHKYWLTVVDDHSRHGWSYPLRTKDQAGPQLIHWMREQERQTARPVRKLHCDRGTEFLNKQVLAHLRDQGIQLYCSNPYSPQQNGIAEARNKTVTRIMRQLLLHSSAPLSLWCFALSHATHLANLLPHRLLDGKTPAEVFTGTKPSMRRLKVWGCTGHVLLNKLEQRKAGGKLGPKTKSCVYLGTNPEGPGFLLWDAASRKSVHSSDVAFQQDVPYYTNIQGTPPTWADFTLPADSASPCAGPAPEEHGVQGQVPVEPGRQGQEPAEHAESAEPAQPLHEPAAADIAGAADERVGEGQPEEDQPFPRRSARLMEREQRRQLGQQPPPLLWSTAQGGYTTAGSQGEEPASALSARALPPQVYATAAVIAGGESGDKVLETPTPSSWQEAVQGPHSAEWLESMAREFSGLLATGTFEEAPREEARNIIKSKWVYRVKRTPEGLPHFKSLLVAKGFSQREGVDFHDTWAPTAKHATARCVLHLAGALDLELHAMDVDQAFLQGELEETLYMEPPPCISGVKPGHVWRLAKPIYGLKQAPRQWHAKLKGVLLAFGFKRSSYDPSLFIKSTGDNNWVLVYVDDLLLLAKDLPTLQALKDQLRQHFPLKDLGPVSQYLGMEVDRERNTREVHLSQVKYITALQHKFQEYPVKAYDTPLANNSPLTLPAPEEAVLKDQDRFPELVGGLMYLMVCTRPDLAHSLSVLGRFIAPGRHGAEHWKAALRVLGYVISTQHLRLTLGGQHTVLEGLMGFTDASWADILPDRRSSQGYSLSLGSGAISWRATRSPAVALSSCEAELYAATTAAQELLWLKRLLRELGYPTQRPVLYCDNRSTVALTKDPLFSARSKHIEARYFFLRDLGEAKELSTQHLPGEVNVADIFTKPLPADRHHQLLRLLGLTDASPSRGCVVK